MMIDHHSNPEGVEDWLPRVIPAGGDAEKAEEKAKVKEINN